jgi:membrane-bound ClpP family serine protease
MPGTPAEVNAPQKHGDSARVAIFEELAESPDSLRSDCGDAREIDLVLDTPGGSADHAFRLADFFSSRNTVATVPTRCASAGVVVLLACGRCRMLTGARLMAHTPQDVDLRHQGGPPPRRTTTRTI